jgi:hypothetical protein
MIHVSDGFLVKERLFIIEEKKINIGISLMHSTVNI